MNPVRVLGFVALMAAASSAAAGSFLLTTDTVLGAVAATVDGVSDLTSSLQDAKVVRAARDDAASFVASEGSIRGARLEAALRYIRQELPSLAASDLQLAQAIISR